jgi:hypothetical protein
MVKLNQGPGAEQEVTRPSQAEPVQPELREAKATWVVALVEQEVEVPDLALPGSYGADIAS